MEISDRSKNNIREKFERDPRTCSVKSVKGW